MKKTTLSSMRTTRLSALSRASYQDIGGLELELGNPADQNSG
jgi:hypothetical protein